MKHYEYSDVETHAIDADTCAVFFFTFAVDLLQYATQAE